ncbi:hypothetical protein GCM10009760_21370 [Kitasatospora kazusensis]|uniref:L-lysine N6-monooxygenase MbtG n=1 Tax=Kitasatospora kazusensis TaxID=407974 RepID=A0ABP5L3K7_9ACTN
MTGTDTTTLDVLGLGLGPANLALAVALDERTPYPKTRFLERQDQFGWHPGMMLEGAGVQNSFLKDLVTLRNPASPYSFLAYLKAHGRLHQFINLAQPHSSRWEFNDYFRWVAGHFADQVDYGWEVVRISPNTGDDGVARTVTVTAANAGGEERTYVTRNIVLGIGGRPCMLSGTVPASPKVIHSSQFLTRLAELHPDRSAPITVAVVGGGQSGAELTHYLARELPRSTVHWILPESAPRPADDTPYVNDIFMESEVDRHYAATRESADPEFHTSLRNSNYGVSDVDLLHSLYRLQYQEAARGQERVHIHTRSRLIGAHEENDRLSLKIAGAVKELRADLIVLATGYERDLSPEMAGDLLPLLQHDADGRLMVERGYRVATRPELAAGVYVQGMAEHSHGLGDTLLPVMAFRSDRIAEQLVADRRAGSTDSYPPARHREDKPELLHAVMRKYPMAVLSSTAGGVLRASNIPLVLDAGSGPHGTLFGHFDANNPQVADFDGAEVLVVFQGPDAYISPRTYASDQLPTWNFVSVHARGTARILRDEAEVVAGLVSIPASNDHRSDAYRLPPDEHRIPKLINGIVGFRIEIQELEGRFKLSQDRDPQDRDRARDELARAASADQSEFIGWLHERAVGAAE